MCVWCINTTTYLNIYYDNFERVLLHFFALLDFNFLVWSLVGCFCYLYSIILIVFLHALVRLLLSAHLLCLLAWIKTSWRKQTQTLHIFVIYLFIFCTLISPNSKQKQESQMWRTLLTFDLVLFFKNKHYNRDANEDLERRGESR